MPYLKKAGPKSTRNFPTTLVRERAGTEPWCDPPPFFWWFKKKNPWKTACLASLLVTLFLGFQGLLVTNPKFGAWGLVKYWINHLVERAFHSSILGMAVLGPWVWLTIYEWSPHFLYKPSLESQHIPEKWPPSQTEMNHLRTTIPNFAGAFAVSFREGNFQIAKHHIDTNLLSRCFSGTKKMKEHAQRKLSSGW